jgi:hypothetical protein
MKSRIRWGRVIVAALFSELAVIAVLMAFTGVYILMTHKTGADLQQFGAQVGYYLAPPASGLATFLSALWATRRLGENIVLTGTLVGVAAVLLTAGFLFGAKPEDRLMYIVSFAIRIAAGYLGGLTAQARFHRTRAISSPVVGQAG